MAISISKPIVGFSVKKEEVKTETPVTMPPKTEAAITSAPSVTPATMVVPQHTTSPQPTLPGMESIHENLERPEMLIGSTYKIKTPLSEHSLYITINDMILNQGTSHEFRRPFEVFINSKNMDHFQWIVALTRVMSAVFRKGGDITFLVEELHSVFDPKGGYLKAGGRYIPSLVAEIGDVIEMHLKNIGMIPSREIDPSQQEYLDKKRKEYLNASSSNSEKQETATSDSSFPAGATLCSKCNVKAVVRIDNCATCLNCGDSKCG